MFEKVRESRRKFKKVGEGWRKLEKVEKVGEGREGRERSRR